MFREVSSNLRFHPNGYVSNITAVTVTKKEAFLPVGFGQFSDIKEAKESSLPDSFVELTVTAAAPQLDPCQRRKHRVCLPQVWTLSRMLSLVFRCLFRTNRMGNSAKTKLS